MARVKLEMVFANSLREILDGHPKQDDLVGLDPTFFTFIRVDPKPNAFNTLDRADEILHPAQPQAR